MIIELFKDAILANLARRETVNQDDAGSMELHKLGVIAAKEFAGAVEDAEITLGPWSITGLAAMVARRAVNVAYSDMGGDIDCDSSHWPDVVREATMIVIGEHPRYTALAVERHGDDMAGF